MVRDESAYSRQDLPSREIRLLEMGGQYSQVFLPTDSMFTLMSSSYLLHTSCLLDGLQLH